MTVHAYLEIEQEATRGDYIWTLPVASFVVSQWDELPDTSKGVTLSLYECEYEDSKTGAAPTEKTEIAVVTFNLIRNTEPAKEGQGKPPAFAVSRPRLTKGLKSKQSNKKRKESADFGLYLGGGTTIWIKVPLRLHRFHREGFFFEVGLVLEAKGQPAYERLEWGKHARVYADRVRKSLRISTKVTGAFKVGGPERKNDVLGRFNDPKRNPSVEPKQLRTLERATGKAIRAQRAGGPPADVDGLRFFYWDRTPFKPGAREETIDTIVDGSASLQQAIADAPDKDPFLKGDIEKAYFVIHDVGMDGARLATDFWKPGKRVSKKHVHGFLNKDGSFALGHDFFEKGAGVVYQGTSMGAWIKWLMINLETTPVVETHDGDTDWTGKKYACMGVGQGKNPNKNPKKKADNRKPSKVTLYWKWPHSLLDALADLYIFASARADHLLTITTHLECDRNVAYSQVHYEYPKSKRLKKKLKNAKSGSGHAGMRDGPGNVHGDPYCFPLQILYDKITERLNGLAEASSFKLVIPTGARYGIHPDRILHQDGRDFSKLVRKMGNRSDAIHTFPHQSHPTPELFRMKTKEQKKGKTNYAKEYWK